MSGNGSTRSLRTHCDTDNDSGLRLIRIDQKGKVMVVDVKIWSEVSSGRYLRVSAKLDPSQAIRRSPGEAGLVATKRPPSRSSGQGR